MSDERDRKRDNVGPFSAHSEEGEPPEHWQRLEDHLKNVEEMAREFAEAFGAGE